MPDAGGILLLALVQAGPPFAVALVLGLYGTPIAREAALRFGIVDRPDGRLKTHATAVPYLGGLAIYGAFLVATALAMTLGLDRRVLGLLLGGSILVLVGLVDDLGSLSPGAKLLGQVVAALVAVRSGIVVQLHYLTEDRQALELVLNAAFSMLWLVAATNAVNLIDIMDGLAASASLVAATSLMVVAVLNGRPEVLCVTAALAGAILGFLRFNGHPAQIYMGDAGALFIGFMLGALCLIGSYTATNPLGFLTPLYLMAVPLFDTALVSVVRLSRGMSPLRGSPDHFALRLRRRGFSVTTIVRATAAGGAVLGVLGVVQLLVPARISLALAAGVALALGILGVWLSREARRGEA